MLKNFNITSKMYIKIVWIIFSLIATLLGMKLKNMLLTIVLITGIPIILYLIKNPKYLIYAQIIYVLLIRIFISMIKILPNSATYVMDIINILAFIIALRKKIKEKEKLQIKSPVIIVMLLLIFSIIGLIVNGQSIFLYIWGFRNIYRVFAFMYSCIVLLDKEDLYKIMKIFKVTFILNIFLCTYQYFVLHLHQDEIGGIFGIEVIGNMFMNVYMIIVFTYSLVRYLDKKEKISYLLLVSVGTLYIAAISEIKVFFVEFIIIIMLGVLFSRLKVKTIAVVAIFIMIIIMAMNIFYTIYPEFKEFFKIDTIIDSASNDVTGRLNRITALSDIDRMFFKDNKTKLLGMGLGSTDTSKIAIFNSNFYNRYGERLRYLWLFDAAFTLENGYIGLIMYIFFFIAVFYENFKMKKVKKDKTMYTIVQVLSIMSIFIMWYDPTFRTESAYMMIFALSMGYIYNKSEEKDVNKLEEKVN